MSAESRRRRTLWSAVSISIIATAGALILVFVGGGSAASKVLPVNNGAKPSISDTTPQDGEQLTADPGGWTPDAMSGTTFDYQWQRDGSDIGGANSHKYTVTSNDVGHKLKVGVVAHNGPDTSAQVFSDATSTVTGTVPKNTSPPTISGTAQDNQILTANNGSWSGSPTDFFYQWQRCDSNGNNCADITGSGATGSTYHVSSADVGHRLRVVVTAKNDGGKSDPANSGTTSTVIAATATGTAPVNTSLPSISGTAQENQFFTGNQGSWNPSSGNNFTYQWQRCDSNGNNCTTISGATSTSYRLTSNDVGHRLRFMVTASNSLGHSSATSLASNVVSSASNNTTSTTTTTTGTTNTTPGGGKVIPVTSVVPPNRLVVSSTRWTPRTIGAVGQQLTARIRIIDANGTSVSGALVYATGIPFNRVSIPPETFTDASGWATLTFIVGRGMPIKKGALLQVFIRTRKAGEDILSGVSSRRLISVRVVPAA